MGQLKIYHSNTPIESLLQSYRQEGRLKGYKVVYPFEGSDCTVALAPGSNWVYLLFDQVLTVPQIQGVGSLFPLMIERNPRFLAPRASYETALRHYFYTFGETFHPRMAAVIAVATTIGKTAIAIPYDQISKEEIDKPKRMVPDLHLNGHRFCLWRWFGTATEDAVSIAFLLSQNFRIARICDQEGKEQPVLEEDESVQHTSKKVRIEIT